ncbi:MAG TPA: trehalose-phosphatase [Longimicrobiales bacterium]|nr:trehalose-phosphatase [Longimicrobiales bacterium]
MMLQDAMELLDGVRAARAAAGHLLVGLDFDGTLAPIVPLPQDAVLPPATRPVLERLAARPDTQVALVSGRGLADLVERVGMPGLFYAGNHGLEIEGPGVHRVHAEAAAARQRLSRLARRLHDEVGGVEGAIVEDKGLTLSVHYRRVAGEAGARRVRAAAHACCEGEAGLRVTDGKMVVEIRPDVDWHKGRALRFLRETLTAEYGDTPALFIGDDTTDEDAFRELGAGGWGILVGSPPPGGTAARAALATTGDVAAFLGGLA